MENTRYKDYLLNTSSLSDVGSFSQPNIVLKHAVRSITKRKISEKVTNSLTSYSQDHQTVVNVSVFRSVSCLLRNKAPCVVHTPRLSGNLFCKSLNYKLQDAAKNQQTDSILPINLTDRAIGLSGESPIVEVHEPQSHSLNEAVLDVSKINAIFNSFL